MTRVRYEVGSHRRDLGFEAVSVDCLLNGGVVSASAETYIGLRLLSCFIHPDLQANMSNLLNMTYTLSRRTRK